MFSSFQTQTPQTISITFHFGSPLRGISLYVYLHYFFCYQMINFATLYLRKVLVIAIETDTITITAHNVR